MHHELIPGAAAGAEVRKSQLSQAQQRLVDLMARVRFGRIESLRIVSGQPLLDPPPRVTRTLKVGARSDSPVPSSTTVDDFVLKAAVVELIAHLARLGDGVVGRIEIAHGIPLLLEVHEPLVA